MRLESFDQFNSSPQESLLESLLVLNEEKCMAKYTLNEFKNFFKNTMLLESVNDEDNLMLEKAHAYYEISMLSESKSSWFNGISSPVYLDAEDHMILVNNNEAFIIAKSTYTAINESWGWDDITGAWNSFTSKVVSVAKSVTNKVAKVVDAMSAGVKKAWEWVKAAGSAAVKFMSKMTWVDWATLGLGVLSACMGSIGSAIPGATIIAGAILAITGGLHIYEGHHKFSEAKEKLKNITAGNYSKNTAAINVALPDIAMGSIFTILGINDLAVGLTRGLADPTAGLQSLGIKGAAINGGKKAIKSMAHKIEYTIGGGWAGKAMENLGKSSFAKEFAEKAVGYTGMQIVGILGHGVLVSCLGWIYKACLKLEASLMKGISWLLDLPQKLTDGIEKLSKNATGVVGKIIAKGLNLLVKPLTSSAATVINNYVKKPVNDAKKWFDRQVIIYDVCVKAIKEEKSKAHESLLTEEEDSIPGVETIEIPQDEIKIIKDTEPPKATDKDKELLKKIPDKEIDKEIKDQTGPGYDHKNPIKDSDSSESNNFKLRYLKLFENFK